MITLVDIRTQYEIAKAYQTHESFRLVASEVFNGGKTSGGSPSSGAKPIESFSELAAAFNTMGGSIGG